MEMQPVAGIIVVVHDGRWEAFGAADDIRAQYLFKVLESMGGVSDTVKPGTYAFNEMQVGNKIVRSLEPFGIV